jgi:dinuclear metal center YbgI/SA1388 family protein
MTLPELDAYFNSFLKKENFPDDPSQNGIQIQNSAPDSKQITKVAFAVDTCCDAVEKAAAAGAQLLFVHHGLFWGQSRTITGLHYSRIASFIRHDIALYASHLPLDANTNIGNNYGLAARLCLGGLQPFGLWRGMVIGVRGILPQPLTLEELSEAALGKNAKPAALFSFGRQKIKTVAIISGGAGDDADQAAAAGVDAYITGEVGHEDFYTIKESGLNVIAGGHYQTETVGVNLVRAKLEKEMHLETVFLDLPTGL